MRFRPVPPDLAGNPPPALRRGTPQAQALPRVRILPGGAGERQGSAGAKGWGRSLAGAASFGGVQFLGLLKLGQQFKRQLGAAAQLGNTGALASGAA